MSQIEPEIPAGHRQNFVTLQQAFANDDAVLVRCTDRATGQLVTAICVGSIEPGNGGVLPFAVLLSGDPHQQLELPEQLAPIWEE
jgi:hypothetical protein